jgi:hypothetical protein
MTSTPAAPIWRDYYDITPGQYAQLYTAAAAYITDAGYTAYSDCEGEEGISIHDALVLAATAAPGEIAEWMIDNGVAEVTERAETKLMSVLILSGQVTSDYGIHGWERGLNRRGTASQADALQLLTAAAAIMSVFPANG